MDLLDIDTRSIIVNGLNNNERTVFNDNNFFYKIFKTPQTEDFLFSIYKQKFKLNDFFCGRYLLRECNLQYFNEKESLIGFELQYLNQQIAPAFCDVIMHKNTLVGYKTFKGTYKYSILQFNYYVELLVDHCIKKNIIIPDVTKENVISVNNKLSIIDFSDAILEIPRNKNSKFYDILQFYLKTSDSYYSELIKRGFKL